MFRRLFGRNRGIEVATRKPTGRFRVSRVLALPGRKALLGEVLEGVIYPGYKLKGKGVALVRSIERERRRVDFAVPGDEVALITEGEIEAGEGEVLEVYPS
ncbi:tRNA-binding protein Pbp11 [Palaeococcus ferrophilus]|uniref:tRNA-binding protein Pbp11 n=1 Tax=Palaeococcus ferrophilus TaxID=83868 RepID=UPI00064EB2DE|nr:tRNA-binding protein Pbp11 [Palaeococcus ferrophilus]